MIKEVRIMDLVVNLENGSRYLKFPCGCSIDPNSLVIEKGVMFATLVICHVHTQILSPDEKPKGKPIEEPAEPEVPEQVEPKEPEESKKDIRKEAIEQTRKLFKKEVEQPKEKTLEEIKAQFQEEAAVQRVNKPLIKKTAQ